MFMSGSIASLWLLVRLEQSVILEWTPSETRHQCSSGVPLASRILAQPTANVRCKQTHGKNGSSSAVGGVNFMVQSWYFSALCFHALFSIRSNFRKWLVSQNHHVNELREHKIKYSFKVEQQTLKCDRQGHSHFYEEGPTLASFWHLGHVRFFIYCTNISFLEKEETRLLTYYRTQFVSRVMFLSKIRQVPYHGHIFTSI